MSPDSIQEYATLLRIRQTAARRSAIIAGVLFGASTFAALYSNLSIESDSRTLFLNTILIMIFGLGFVFEWSRFDTIKGILELVDEVAAAKERQ